MKCIKKLDKYLRVSNSEATRKVREGWIYCSKSEWKDDKKAK